MKKYFFIFSLIIAGLFFGRTVLAEERIANFDVAIRINIDATINVEEKIVYDFSEAEKHGIYREIPIKYQARGGNFNLRISDISVVDQNNEPYTTDITYSGDNINIKIGDADRLVTGEKTYVINYKINRAINYFSDYDELYWNATGNDWTIPIDKTTATLELPQDFKKEELKIACYYGAYGSTENCNSSIAYDMNGMAREGVYGASNLDIGEGMTAVLGWPIGVVKKPSVWELILETVRDNLILILPIIVFLFLFFRWRKYGRDPEGRGTIIPEYEAPDNLTPIEVGTLIDEKADKKDVSAEIISLAVRGYLKINYIPKEGFFGKVDYKFDRLKQPDDLADEFDKKLIAGLFSSGESAKLSDLKNKFYKDLQTVTNLVYKSTVSKGYFSKNPSTTRIAYAVAGVAILFLAFFIGPFFGGLGIGSLVACGIIVLISSPFMPARTAKGVLAKEKILGLKLYLTVAEKDRIKFHNAPEKNPQEFEKFLPYAMVLGVEEEWAGQFKDIYNQQPNWYNDPTHGNFTTLALVSSLNSFQSQAHSTLASSPSSSSSGGSGFSGGGSGGGFGGGGGGSW
jgi:uncharacterized membrane protein